MATNDLMVELQKDSIKLDDDSERKVSKMAAFGSRFHPQYGVQNDFSRQSVIRSDKILSVCQTEQKSGRPKTEKYVISTKAIKRP